MISFKPAESAHLVQCSVEKRDLCNGNESVVGVGILEQTEAIGTVKSCSILEHGDGQDLCWELWVLGLVDRRDGDIRRVGSRASLVRQLISRSNEARVEAWNDLCGNVTRPDDVSRSERCKVGRLAVEGVLAARLVSRVNVSARFLQ